MGELFLADAMLVFLVVSAVIVIGAVSSYLFARTGIPDMVFLVILGLIVGPGLGFIKLQDVMPFMPFLSILALVIILFDGGLGMSIRRAFDQAPRAIVLAVVGFFLSVLAVTLFARYFLNLSLIESALLGSIIGGSSSIVVVAIARQVGVTEACSTTLILESTMTDVLCIVAALVLMEIASTGLPTFEALTHDVAARFAIGIVIGAGAGLIWLGILPRLTNAPYRYMVTLATIFLTYFASQFLGGSGGISALVFGLTLGNSDGILALIGRSGINVLDESFSRLQSEIVFLVKAFFFVYLGLIVSFPDIHLLIVASILCVILLAVRSATVSAVTIRSKLASERGVMTAIYGRGLAAAILSVLPLQYGLPKGDFYPPIVLLVIIFTALITGIGATRIKKPQKPPAENKQPVQFKEN
jgi:cell volume regulation protein A